MKNLSQKIIIAIDLLLLAAAAVYISYVAGFWQDYPIGTDSYAHLSKIKFLAEYFPNFDWNHLWANGMPMFLWYSSVPYFIIYAIYLICNSYELAINLASILAVIIIAFSSYLLVYESTKNRLAAFLSGLLMLSMPAVWGRFAMGEIPRFIATSFLPLSWWIVVRYLSQPNPSKKLYFFTLVIITLSLSGHYIITGLTVFTLVFIAWWLLGFTRKFYDLLKDLYLPAFLLSCFTLLSFLVSTGIKQVFGEGFFGGESFHQPLKILSFFQNGTALNNRIAWMDSGYGAFLPWLVLPLIGIFLLIAISRREKMILPWDNWRILKAFFFMNILFALYGLSIYFGFPGNLYNASLPPTDTFYFLSLGLPILFGLAYHFAIKSVVVRQISFAVVAILIAITINQYYPFISFTKNININTVFRNFNKEDVVKNELKDVLPADTANSLYRYAHNNSFVAVWFNYDFPFLAQTRDYYSQALLNSNDKFWFEDSVFHLNDNTNETKFLLDWFAVKWLSVSYPNFNFEKFQKLPELFQLKSTNNNPIKEERFDVYEYTKPRPIIEATNAQTVLVIGDDAAYRNFLFVLAKLNIGSDKLIPIRGNQMIDLYTIDDLKQFDAIFLNNFNYLEKENAFSLLDQYAYAGGKVMIESAGILSKPEGVIAFLPAPVQKINPGQFGTTWDFKAGNLSEIFQNVDLNEFGPAIYGDQKLAWSMLYAEPNELRADAFPILLNHDKVVVSGLNRGEGKVVFSGLNLLYHYNNYPTENEGRFVANLLNYVLDLDQGDDFIQQTGTINDPHLREVILDKTGYKGVLLKENYFANWSAKISDSTSSANLTIHKAGPNLMYVHLPENIQEKAKVQFIYHRSWLEWGSIIVSLLSAIWVVYHLFFYAPHPTMHPTTINNDKDSDLPKKPTKKSKKTNKIKTKHVNKKKTRQKKTK
ncbi:MAG: 6-pyruvoyl-tetrahydropterin synthase-related protein [Patescibacteria group bacterium]